MKTNISILTYSAKKTGGIEQVTNDLYDILFNAGYIVEIISFDEIKRPKNKLSQKLYKHFYLKKKINNIIQAQKAGIVISMHPFLSKYLVFNENRYKKICWVHGIDIFGKNGVKYKSYLEQCLLIVSVSNFTKNHMIEIGYNENNIKVINNCVDLNIFQYKRIDKIGNTLKLLTTGRLAKNERYKGHDLVIKALKNIMNSSQKGIKYIIVGDGDDRERLEKLAYDEGVENYVEFRGNVSFKELINAYEECHIFVMPSYFEEREDGTYTGEGFGIVYIEAGAIGRAIVGCDMGGQTDIIIDDFNGKFVKPEKEDISKKVLFLIHDVDLLEKMGNNNRKLVEEKFSKKVFEKKVIELINEL